MEGQIKKLLQQSNQFSNLDLHFADFLTRLEGNWMLELYLAAALVSRSRSQGHICLDLHLLAGASLLDGETSDPLPCPEYHDWLNKLKRSTVVGSSGEFKPLILDEAGRLYLYRYWDYQQQLANALRLRLDQTEMAADFESLAAKLDRYFPPKTDHEIDWQKIAALTAWQNRFCVISGGARHRQDHHHRSAAGAPAGERPAADRIGCPHW